MPQNKTIKIGDVKFKVLYGDLLPTITDDDYDRLKASIKEIGIMVPVLTDENGGIIDGRHRLEAAAELKLKTVPTNILHGMDGSHKRHLAIKLNTQRRHLSKEEKAKLATGLRKDGLSLRQIADILNVGHVTVSRILEGVPNETPDKVKGKDGKEYPATINKPKTRTNTNTVAEAKRVFEACESISPADLPKSTIDVKRVEKVSRQVKINKKRSQDHKDFKVHNANLMIGDFRDRCYELPDSSVDLCFTDPLYEKDALPVWGDLSTMCARKLKHGGILMAYSGVLYLPDIHRMLGEHLNYMWTAAIYHSGHTKLVRAVQIQQAWKPVLVYYKPPLHKYWSPFKDMVTGGQEKDHHQYEQAASEAIHYIKALCPANGVLLDPMMGSGTTIAAGLQADIGIKCIGCEIDGAAYSDAQARIEQVAHDMTIGKKTA